MPWRDHSVSFCISLVAGIVVEGLVAVFPGPAQSIIHALLYPSVVNCPAIDTVCEQKVHERRQTDAALSEISQLNRQVLDCLYDIRIKIEYISHWDINSNWAEMRNTLRLQKKLFINLRPINDDPDDMTGQSNMKCVDFDIDRIDLFKEYLEHRKHQWQDVYDVDLHQWNGTPQGLNLTLAAIKHRMLPAEPMSASQLKPEKLEVGLSRPALPAPVNFDLQAGPAQPLALLGGPNPVPPQPEQRVDPSQLISKPRLAPTAAIRTHRRRKRAGYPKSSKVFNSDPVTSPDKMLNFDEYNWHCEYEGNCPYPHWRGFSVALPPF